MIQHLILHKVRGEPAFDVAHELEPDVWIVSTSGHRAYPVRTWQLDELVDASDINNNGGHNRPTDYEDDQGLASAQDHYDVMPQAQKKDVGQLLKLLGAKTVVEQPYNGTKMRRL